MKFARSRSWVCLWIMLASPSLGVYVRADDSMDQRPLDDSVANLANLQLAAAIGMVKPKPEPVTPPETPVDNSAQPSQPTVKGDADTASPGTQTAETSEEQRSAAKSLSRRPIVIGAWVAAVLGALALGVGGDGGGNASTPQH